MDFILYSCSFQKSENFFTFYYVFCLIIYSSCTVMVSCVKDFFGGEMECIHIYRKQERERERESSTLPEIRSH